MAPGKKGPVFRVTGLPASQPDDELNTALKIVIHDNLSNEEKSQLNITTAIVPSCHNNEQERIALVEFRGGVPDFLSELVENPLGDWQVEMDDVDISFDQHFFGFTQLYTPKSDAPVTADIIAITGLDGHAYGSWRGKGNLGRMWLRDFLSKDLPCCRTMIYGYNSRLSSHGIDTIMDYGRELMEELKKVRNTEELRQRPLFFIAHSFGGIILAHLADFKNLIRDRKIVSFYETGQTRQLETAKANVGKRTGEFVTAVDTDSALLQLPDSMEEKIPLASDHSMIVKFDTKSSPGYTSARDKLQRFEKDAPSVVAARFWRAQNRPKPSIMVPFQRDSAFVGREDIIAKILEKQEQAAADNHSRVALVGLGGVGKSQIAIEHAYRVRESAPQTWVFWVHAANAARFEQAYRDIANKAEIPGREDPKADILQLVYNWLRDERNGRWLMVLDNADDDEDFFSHTRPLESFLAQTPNGRILITSRNRIAAMNLVGPHGSIVQVEPMDEEDALALLNTRVPFSESSKADAKTLVYALERIPLAITHAAAYIKTRAPMTTISDYLERFRESEANQKTEQSAVDLLALMSMFDRQGIPVSLLRAGTGQLDFLDALEPLLSFSLVRAEIGNQSFEMHRLVQLSMRKWLKADKQLSRWTKNGDYPTWADCQILFPHARETISHVAGDEEDVLNQAEIAFRAGLFLFLRGEEKALGPDNPNTLASVSNLGSVLSRQGKYDEAEAIYRRALKGYEKALGLEHPSTLTSVNNLGSVLESQGKYDKAEAMHRQALKERKKALGPEHPDTLTSVSNLGSVLSNQGKYEEAEAIYWRALKGCEKALGPEHPDTLSSINNLGARAPKYAHQRQQPWVSVVEAGK
ncbi:hypothetical protein CEP52_017301, partial [Fusarium oligoseptatum]